MLVDHAVPLLGVAWLVGASADRHGDDTGGSSECRQHPKTDTPQPWGRPRVFGAGGDTCGSAGIAPGLRSFPICPSVDDIEATVSDEREDVQMERSCSGNRASLHACLISSRLTPDPRFTSTTLDMGLLADDGRH
jgi:hypothetical protein